MKWRLINAGLHFETCYQGSTNSRRAALGRERDKWQRFESLNEAISGTGSEGLDCTSNHHRGGVNPCGTHQGSEGVRTDE